MPADVPPVRRGRWRGAMSSVKYVPSARTAQEVRRSGGTQPMAGATCFVMVSSRWAL
jgi:hypothetical protein